MSNARPVLERNSHKNGSRNRRGRWSFAAGCCALPFLAVGAIWLTYYGANRPVQIAVPLRVMPSPNGYDDFVRAGQLARAMKHKSPLSMPSPDFSLAAFEAAAKDAQPALAAMRQGFGKEYLSRPLRPRTPLGFPVLATFREVARVQSGVGIYYEKAGKPDLAMESYLDGLEMAVMIPHGGSLLDGLVGDACESIALARTEPILPLLSISELEHAAARLDKIAAKRTPYADTLQEEAYESMAQEVELLKDPKNLTFDAVRTLVVDDAEDESSSSNSLSAPIQKLKQGSEVVRFMLANKGGVIRDNQRFFADLVAEARRPFAGPSAVKIPDNLFARMSGDLFSTARNPFMVREAEQAILRTEVALHRYKRAHGTFPPSLQALDTGILRADAANDPFSGGPLRYRPLKNGTEFLLYSVGPDMKDDSGVPAKRPNDDGGDIVAGKIWKQKQYKK